MILTRHVYFGEKADLGPDHLDTIVTMENLAASYSGMKRRANYNERFLKGGRAY
jgi:hypothetical protein